MADVRNAKTAATNLTEKRSRAPLAANLSVAVPWQNTNTGHHVENRQLNSSMTAAQ